MKDPLVDSLIPTWVRFLEAKLALKLEYCSVERDLTGNCSLMTLSAYSFSWHTQNWLSTIVLATQKLHRCATSSSFLRSNRWILYILNRTLTIRNLVTYNLDHCSRNVFIVFTLTWITRAVKKQFLYPWLLLDLLWKASNIHFQRKGRNKMVSVEQLKLVYYRGRSQQREGGFVSLAQVFGRPAILFKRKHVAQLQNVWVLISIRLLHQKLQGFLVVGKVSRARQRKYGKRNHEKKIG